MPALCYNGGTLFEGEEARRMRKLRRFIWYLAGRLLLITVLLGLFTVTFY